MLLALKKKKKSVEVTLPEEYAETLKLILPLYGALCLLGISTLNDFWVWHRFRDMCVKLAVKMHCFAYLKKKKIRLTTKVTGSPIYFVARFRNYESKYKYALRTQRPQLVNCTMYRKRIKR